MPLDGSEADTLGLADLNRSAEALWLQVQSTWPGFSVDVLPEVESTNTHAMQMGRQGAEAPCVVVAWRQTAGRGRAGRHWQAAPGQTLTMSLAMPLALDKVPGGGSALSLVVGLAVAETLRCLPGEPDVKLKWPNDLWVEGRKLGGILIEAMAPAHLPAGQRWVVIGLGLNLRETPTEQQAHRCDLAAVVKGAAPSAGQAMALLVPAMLSRIHDFTQHGFAPLVAPWAALDALAHQPVALWSRLPDGVSADHPDAPPPSHTGTACGVAPDGALLVQDAAGQLQRWQVGDVSVRPGTRPSPL